MPTLGIGHCLALPSFILLFPVLPPSGLSFCSFAGLFFITLETTVFSSVIPSAQDIFAPAPGHVYLPFVFQFKGHLLRDASPDLG